MTSEGRISRLEQQVKDLLVILSNYAANSYPPLSMFTKFPSTVSLPEPQDTLLKEIKRMIKSLEEEE